MDQHRQSTKTRFEKEYAVDNRKRSFSTMESEDLDSEEERSLKAIWGTENRRELEIY